MVNHGQSLTHHGSGSVIRICNWNNFGHDRLKNKDIDQDTIILRRQFFTWQYQEEKMSALCLWFLGRPPPRSLWRNTAYSPNLNSGLPINYNYVIVEKKGSTYFFSLEFPFVFFAADPYPKGQSDTDHWYNHNESLATLPPDQVVLDSRARSFQTGLHSNSQ